MRAPDVSKQPNRLTIGVVILCVATCVGLIAAGLVIVFAKHKKTGSNNGLLPDML